MDLTILKKYFSINLKDYQNIGIDLEINKLLLVFTVGVIIAALAINFNQTGINLVVKKLLRRNALSIDSAITVGEMCIDGWRTRFLLSTSGRLKKLVGRVGEREYTYEEFVRLNKEKKYKEEKIDFATARFYLREEGIGRSRHIVEVGHTSMLNTILFSILIFAIYVCVSLIMPEILTVVNNMLAK